MFDFQCVWCETATPPRLWLIWSISWHSTQQRASGGQRVLTPPLKVSLFPWQKKKQKTGRVFSFFLSVTPWSPLTGWWKHTCLKACHHCTHTFQFNENYVCCCFAHNYLEKITILTQLLLAKNINTSMLFNTEKSKTVWYDFLISILCRSYIWRSHSANIQWYNLKLYPFNNCTCFINRSFLIHGCRQQKSTHCWLFFHAKSFFFSPLSFQWRQSRCKTSRRWRKSVKTKERGELEILQSQFVDLHSTAASPTLTSLPGNKCKRSAWNYL